jgi:prepilin-type N-terminal cleavage/methylation domain-containing protein
MLRKAFTLVELLVVIAIIGLLSTVAVLSLNASRIKARNAKRIADIKQFVSVFSIARDASATGTYPNVGPSCISTACTLGWSAFGANPTVDAFISPYIATKPVNPTPTQPAGFNGYLYIGDFSGGISPFSGISYPAGAILNYALENLDDCLPGYKWQELNGSSNCILYLD